ncbi:MAG: CBS domain-containing protein [Actinomycetota bacterium]
MPERIDEVMTADVVSLAKDASIRQAGEVMRDRDIGDVLIQNEDGSLCGIVTDRDIVVRAIAEGLDPDSASVEDVCEHDVVTLSSGDAIARAVELMESHAIRRLPVVDNGQVVGVVSIGDLAEHRDPKSALGEISSAPPNN